VEMLGSAAAVEGGGSVQRVVVSSGVARKADSVDLALVTH
jgi:hypothetical protein